MKPASANAQVLAPAAASIEVLDVRPGDLIAPNTPIATLLERDQIYVRIYIPETQIGRVHLGQKAQIRVDSFSNQIFDGTVEQINQQAEFLPAQCADVEERVHQVFGVKVRIDDTRRIASRRHGGRRYAGVGELNVSDLEKPAISAQNLVRRFGSFTAVMTSASASKKAKSFGFLGPNGSGKTTVIKNAHGFAASLGWRSFCLGH